MTEDDLQRMLARNPQLKALENPNSPRTLRATQSQQVKIRSLDNSPRKEARSLERPIVRIVFGRTRPLDRDNAWGSVKALVDGLRHAGLISGDSEEEIELSVDQFKVQHRSEEKTTIEIDYGQTETASRDRTAR
jgi:hypothetical protein